MNHNNKMTFGQYLWSRERKFTLVLLFIALVLIVSVALAWEHEGYERNTTLQICGAIFLAVFGLSAYKLHQNYRDYRNGTRR